MEIDDAVQKFDSLLKSNSRNPADDRKPVGTTSVGLVLDENGTRFCAN